MRLTFLSALRSLGVVSILAVAAAPSGCIITTTDSPPASGSLVVTWTIQGSRDPAACNSHTASEFNIRVYDRNGTQVGPNYRQVCTAFSTSIPVNFAPGNYTLQAELLNSTGNPRTTTVGAPPAPLVSFYIYSNQTTQQDVTFPDASFF